MCRASRLLLMYVGAVESSPAASSRLRQLIPRHAIGVACSLKRPSQLLTPRQSSPPPFVMERSETERKGEGHTSHLGHTTTIYRDEPVQMTIVNLPSRLRLVPLRRQRAGSLPLASSLPGGLRSELS